MDKAKTIFERLNSEQAIQDYIDENPEETQHIDYKQIPFVTEPTKAQRNDVRKFFSEKLGRGLSGFANAEGGVLVFGVRDKQHSDKHTLRPSPIFMWVYERVQRELTHQVAAPVEGVEIEYLESRESPNSGYVIVFVPQSDKAPHRHQKDHEYYRRVGDSFLPMQHYEIADYFGRRHHPVLESYLEPYSRQKGMWVLGVNNTGRTLAKFASLQVSVEGLGFQMVGPVEDYAEEDAGRFRLDRVTNHEAIEFRSTLFAADANVVIHAGTGMPVALIQGPVPEPGARLAPFQPAFRLTVVLAAEGMAAQRLEKSWIWGELYKL